MSYSVKKTTITLTRGDTCKIQVSITNPGGTPYELQENDIVKFAMKKSYNDEEALIVKTIPNDTLILTLNPDDTKDLAFGSYVYDIELTKETGEVDTFITKAELKLTEEVA